MAFSVRWPVLFLEGRQCHPYTVTTSSFQILTASWIGMSIYTHPTALRRAADAPDLPNLCKTSPQPSLCESKVLSAWLRVGVVWLSAWEHIRAILTLSTCWASSIFIVHLLLLELKPPRRLGIVRRAPVLVVSSRTACKFILQLVKSPLLQEVTLLFGERGTGKP